MKQEETANIQQHDEMSLPDNAFRPLKDGEKYVPVMRLSATIPR